MEDVRKLFRIQILTTLIFVVFKFSRPSVLEGGSPDLVKLIFLSLPNFLEAIVGMTTVCALGLVANHRLLTAPKRLKAEYIYLLSVLFTAIYVITQEFKLHNIGGNNVYDPNDVLFSVIDLIIGYVIILTLKPRISE